MKLFEYLRQGDLFGSHFQFTMNGETTFKSSIGLLLTLVFYAALVFGMVIYVSDYVDPTSVDSQSSTLATSSGPRQEINGKNGLYLMFLLRNGSYFVQPKDLGKIATVSLTVDTYKKIDDAFDSTAFNKTSVNLEVASCSSQSWFTELSKNYFSDQENIQFSTFSICGQANSIEIKGLENEQQRQEFSISFTPLADPTAPKWSTFKQLEVWPMIIASQYNASNKQTPLSVARDYGHRHRLASKINMEVTYQIGQVVVRSMGGLLGSEFQVDTSSFLEGMSDNYVTVSNADDSSLRIKFVSSNVVTEHTRVYTSFFSMISNIGGVAEIIIIILAIIYAPVDSYVADKSLIRYGIMKKEQNVNLLANEGDEHDPESYSYESVWRHKLVNRGIKKPKDAVELRQAEFWKMAEDLLKEHSDIYNIIKNVNEMVYLRNFFFTKAHRKLAPIVGITLMEVFDSSIDQKTERNMSITDAIEMLQQKEEENPLQREISKMFYDMIVKEEQTFDRLQKQKFQKQKDKDGSGSPTSQKLEIDSYETPKIVELSKRGSPTGDPKIVKPIPVPENEGKRSAHGQPHNREQMEEPSWPDDNS